MTINRLKLLAWLLSLFSIVTVATPARAQNARAKKVYMITDMEGVDGIVSSVDQCEPFKSPRWQESQKLLTDEVNSATEGLYAGGATDVVVADLHDSSRSLSVLTVDPRVRLLEGGPLSPTLELDSSYAAVIFIGQHAMAGAEKGILNHSYSSQSIQHIWVNGKPTGEIGGRTMLAGYFNVPAIMLSGDTAACRELDALVPEAECAEVKSGVSRTAGFLLPHSIALKLIREKAQRAMERLGEIKPYRIAGRVEVRVEFTTPAPHLFRPREGVEQVNERTWSFRGKDIVDAWLKYGDF